jgi:predicted transcriptional regulator
VPDDVALSTHVTIRVPSDVVEAYDRLAKILERPRSWVMVRALRAYLQAEGEEVFEDAEALAALDRGESVPMEDAITEMRETLAAAERRRAERG